MVARGRVQNGVVVLEEGVHFPEGQEVTVLGPPTVPTASSLSDAPMHSVLDVPVVSLGPVLRTLTADDDLLGEMLDARRCGMDWIPAFWWQLTHNIPGVANTKARSDA